MSEQSNIGSPVVESDPAEADTTPTSKNTGLPSLPEVTSELPPPVLDVVSLAGAVVPGPVVLVSPEELLVLVLELEADSDPAGSLAPQPVAPKATASTLTFRPIVGVHGRRSCRTSRGRQKPGIEP